MLSKKRFNVVVIVPNSKKDKKMKAMNICFSLLTYKNILAPIVYSRKKRQTLALILAVVKTLVTIYKVTLTGLKIFLQVNFNQLDKAYAVV